MIKSIRPLVRPDPRPCPSGFRITACMRNRSMGVKATTARNLSIQSQLEKPGLGLQQGFFCDRVGRVSNKRPILVTALVTTTGFVIAAIATNYETAKWQKRVVFDPYPKIKDEISWMDHSYSLQMYSEWLEDGIKRAREHKKKVLETLLDFLTPQDLEIIEGLYESVTRWWSSLLEGQQICRELALGLMAIHLLRYTPFSRSFVTHYFTHNPWSGRVLTLFTSQLGHSGWLHLISNVIKLLSVGELTWYALRYQQTKKGERLYEALSGYHFLAFYFAAGSVASLSSHIWLTQWQIPALTRALLCPKIGSKLASHTPVRTSGASGAVSANMAIFALEWWAQHPATVYFPATEMTMGPLLLGFMAADLFGLRRGWRKIDHAAHIGGAAFGAAYYYLGPPMWDFLRRATDLRRK